MVVQVQAILQYRHELTQTAPPSHSLHADQPAGVHHHVLQDVLGDPVVQLIGRSTVAGCLYGEVVQVLDGEPEGLAALLAPGAVEGLAHSQGWILDIWH